MKKISLLLFFLFSLIIVSCKGAVDELVIPDIDLGNIAAVTNNSTSFSYAITAGQYSKTDSYTLNLTADSVKVTLASASHSSGTIKVEVVLKDGTIPFSRTLQTTYALSDYFKVTSPLAKINLTFSTYSGQFSANLKPIY